MQSVAKNIACFGNKLQKKDGLMQNNCELMQWIVKIIVCFRNEWIVKKRGVGVSFAILVKKKSQILLFSCKTIVIFIQSILGNIVHFKNNWKKSTILAILQQNNHEFVQSIWKKHHILKISLSQILYFGSWLKKKKKSKNFPWNNCIFAQAIWKKKRCTISKSLMRNLWTPLFSNEIVDFINEIQNSVHFGIPTVRK